MRVENSTSKEVMIDLLVSGGIAIALTNPVLLTPAIFIAHYLKVKDKNNVEKTRNAFNYLRGRGYIKTQKKADKILVALSEKGKEKANIYFIQSRLQNKSKQKRWNGVWYVVIFDITDGQKIKRDALRRVLKRSGFIQMQKSVWVYPFNCKKEIELVKDYFNISDEECRVIVSKNIGKDTELRRTFSI